MLAIANPISDCGCFGDAVKLTNWETFWKNIVLLIAAISVFKWRKTGIVKLVSEKVDWLVALYGVVFIIIYTYIAYVNSRYLTFALTISELTYVKEWKYLKVKSLQPMKQLHLCQRRSRKRIYHRQFPIGYNLDIH